jgi:LPPG:FO 2-phospho-L-lactate transferase
MHARGQAPSAASHALISGTDDRTAPLVTVLCGGLGGARLALALQAAGLEKRSCFVTNVADDCENGGLLICPDTDAVLYALAGLFDEQRGWGMRGDVFPASANGDDWFHIGERDRRQHRARAALLATGLSLSAASARLAARLGVRARVLPASDNRLRIHIHTPQGVLAWQEWLVRERAEPPVAAVEYRGVASARASDAVLAAVQSADLLVLAASSPVASIGPTLALPGVAAAIRARRGPTVALSPVVLRRPLLTESDARRARARAALLAAVGREHHPIAVAESYADLIDAYVLDEADEADAGAVERLGLQPLLAPTFEGAGGPRLIAALLGLLPVERTREGTELRPSAPR